MQLVHSATSLLRMVVLLWTLVASSPRQAGSGGAAYAAATAPASCTPPCRHQRPPLPPHQQKTPPPELWPPRELHQARFGPWHQAEALTERRARHCRQQLQGLRLLCRPRSQELPRCQQLPRSARHPLLQLLSRQALAPQGRAPTVPSARCRANKAITHMVNSILAQGTVWSLRKHLTHLTA